MLALLWLVVRPYYLFSRFFVFAVAGAGWAVALAVSRHRTLLAAVVVAAAIALAGTIRTYDDDAIANRVAARALDAADARGHATCVIGNSREALTVYTDHARPVLRPKALKRCDVAVALQPRLDAAVVARASLTFRYHRTLPAQHPGLLFARAAQDASPRASTMRSTQSL